MLTHPHQQQRPVSAPTVQDKTLREYSGNVQTNLGDLWALSHDHIATTVDKAAYAALTTDADRIAFLAQYIGLV